MPNRFVLVDPTGLVYDKTGFNIEISMQDDNLTMVVVLKESPDAQEQQKAHEKNFADSIGGWRDVVEFLAKRFEKGL